MAASVESRVPFLDHELVEFTASIPSKYDTDGLAGKSILKAAIEDLLPKETIHRQKMGFPTPWAYWLGGEQLDQLEKTLLDPRAMDRGYFRPDAVKNLFAEHRAGTRDHGNRIWRLLNLEIWQRVCLEREPVSEVSQTHGVALTR